MEIKLNQSTVKRLGSTIVCPQRYYREEVTGEFKRKASESMIKGQRFEYISFGTKNREGEIPEIPKLKRGGGKSTDEIRIEAQSIRMLEVMKKLGIIIKKTDFHSEYDVNGVVLHSTQDLLGEWEGSPYIFDCKLTADVRSTFGAYSAWGLFDTPDPKWLNHGLGDDVKIMIDTFDPQKFRDKKQMDLLQPQTYTYHMELKTQTKFKFAYIVADYKKNPEIRIIKIVDTPLGRASMLDRTTQTRKRMEYFIATNFAPISSWEECEKCPIMDCAIRMKSAPQRVGTQDDPVYVDDGEVFESTPLDESSITDPFQHLSPNDDPFA